MRTSLPGALLLGVTLSACGAPKQSDAGPPIHPVFEPMAPLVDYSVPPPLPRLSRPERRGEIPTIINADGDRIPAGWSPEEIALSVTHASWRDNPADLTVRMLAWQIEIDDRPLLVEQAILWIHFHPPGKTELWRLVSVYRHPRETRPFLQGWRITYLASPHSGKVGLVNYEEKPDSATVVRFFNDSGWEEDTAGFTLIDGEIGAGAWKRATGAAPGFAYP
jgi:hypothetical protein